MKRGTVSDSNFFVGSWLVTFRTVHHDTGGCFAILRIETCTIAVPAEKVWQGVTTPELVSRYFLTPLLRIRICGWASVMHFEALGAVTVEAEILELEEGKKLVHSFAFTPETHEEVEFADPYPRG